MCFLLVPTSVPGLHGQGQDFAAVTDAIATTLRQQALKFELQIPITDPSKPTACMSANYHLDSFGRSAELLFADGTPAHSACVGFGIERIALALFGYHGTALQHWPREVRHALAFPTKETAPQF